MYVTPEVVKRTSAECTRNPSASPYSVPEDTKPEENPLFMRKVIEMLREKYGEECFIFSPDGQNAGSTDYITEELVAMAVIAGIVITPGMKLTSHGLRRGMLTEFILQTPRSDNIVIAGRMDWAPRAGLTVTYFCKNVVKSWASAVLFPGALQMQVEVSN